MGKTVVVVILITIFSKILGFGREMTLSYFYGASGISDAYLISLTIPLTIFAFIGTGIATSYIPLYTKIEKLEGTISADRFTNNLMHAILILCSCLLVVVWLFTSQIVKLFAYGFEGETLVIAIQFTRITITGIYFSALVYVFNGYLRLKNNFFIPAMISVPLNMVIIISIVMSLKFNIYFLAMGGVLGIAAQLLFLSIPSAYKKGYRYKLVIERTDKHLKEMMYLCLPVILGASVQQINVLVDRTLASKLAIGGISALHYANNLNGIVQGIFVVSIVAVMYPLISKKALENDLENLKKSLFKMIGSINLLIVPSMVGMIMFAEPIVALLFGRGEFDEKALKMTSGALIFYAFGMLGVGLSSVLSKVFYALQDTRTPMINAAITMVLNIILNLVLSRYLGINGLALATSIAAVFGMIMLFIRLRNKIGRIGGRRIMQPFFKIIGASLVMIFFAKWSYNSLLNRMNDHIALLIAIGIAAVLYLMIIVVLKLEPVEELCMIVKGSLNKRST